MTCRQIRENRACDESGGSVKALVQHAYGDPASALRVEERPAPQPGPGEVRVRVRYASINPLDWKLVAGSYRWMSKARPPCGVGFDLAGEVVASGQGATRFARGTRVAGLIPAFSRPPGAIAQFALVPEQMLIAVPDRVPLDQAAALPVAGLSALQMTRLANVQRGRRVLVHGAAGGVGHLAAQIARNIGALVTVTGSAASHAMLKELRPERVIDYRAPPSAWGAYDAVLDCVGLLDPRDLRTLLAEDGIYASTTPRFPQVIADTLLNLVRRSKRRVLMLKLKAPDIEWLMQQLAAGALKVVIMRSYPLTEAAAALAQSRAGHVHGKLVVAID
jgi:NADPH:quinone reductase-like Zn-dependent oxidoreductase